MGNAVLNCTVAIVGGGPAGLALGTELKRLGVENVVVFEREVQAGGVPRHCGHYPFGVRELKRLLKGPEYARVLVRNAMSAGVDIRTGTTVTALHPNARLSLSTPDGLMDLQAERVVLCTGVRESSRAQRFLSGQRPQGIISTGALQSMVYLHGRRPFNRPVILGTELVSFSAIMTCRHLGMQPVAMIEENKRITARQFMRLYPAIMGVPIRFGASDLRILGDRTVEAIEYTDQHGLRQTIKTDGVIVSGKFRPESALLYTSNIEIDPATAGPSVDQYGRTTDPRYFCTGNLLRPVETSSWCWKEAVECAARVARDLVEPLDIQDFVRLGFSDSIIKFVMPQRLIQSDEIGAMEAMQIRLTQSVIGQLTIRSAGKTLWSDAIHSRPERRILAPLSPVLNVNPREAVELSIAK